MAHNKLSLISAYNTINKYDKICISESYLNNTAVLSVDGYSLVRADHPDSQKKVVYVCTLKNNES